MKRTGWALFLLTLATTAWAQLDPKAQPFLDAYTAYFTEAQVPQPEGGKLETIDMTMCVSINVPEAPPETCTRTVLNYSRRWLMSETQGEDGFKMVYRDGKVQMRSISLGGEPFTLPRAETRKIERQFKTMFKQLQEMQNGKWSQQDFESSHYDGFVRYGKVIAGEQVTTTVTAPSFGMVPGDTQSATTRFIFNKEKTVIGMVIKTPQGKMLSIPNNPKAKNPLAWFMNATYYTLKGNKPVRQGTMRLTRYRLNAPLEERLFTLTPER